MVKQTEPRWGYRPPGYKDKNPFTEDIVAQLAKCCRRDTKEQRQQLRKLLGEAVSGLNTLRYLGENEVEEKHRKAALTTLHRQASQLLKTIEAADSATRRDVFSAYPGYRIDGEVEAPVDGPMRNSEMEPFLGIDDEAGASVDGVTLFRRDIEHLRRLKRAVEEAASIVCVRLGRPRATTLRFICEKLAGVYENFTGQPFTYSPAMAPGNRGKKEFTSPGSAFVAMAARAFVPNATNENLGTAMRDIAGKHR